MDRPRLLAASSLFFFVVAPGIASALPANEASCRDVVAGSMTRYAIAAGKAVVRCHQKRSAGDRPLGTDCNDVAQASNDGKLAKALDQARSAILASCAGAEGALSSYASCPAPVAATDDGGATHGIDNFDELVDCLAALANLRAGDIGLAAEGNPDERLLDPLRKCQQRLGKGTNRILGTHLAEGRRCQGAADTSGDGGFACEDADPRGRIHAALSRYAAKVGPFCDYPPEVLGKIGACSNDKDQLVGCSSFTADGYASELIERFYSFGESSSTTTTLEGVTTTTITSGGSCGGSAPACDGSCPNGLVCETSGDGCACAVEGTGTCAPATIHRRIISRYSTDVDSVTELNAGWSGLAFHIDFPNKSGDWVDVDNCDDNCDCQVHLRPQVENGASPCRCTSDASKSCSVINGSDAASCGSVDPTCRCYFGAPLPTVASGNPACIAFRIRKDHGGTVNLRSGEWKDNISVAAIVYLGLDKAAPCPVCNGDPVANDGIRGGTCSGAGGGACDVNGLHSTFGALSNDCLPPAASNISGVGLLVGVDQSTGLETLAATLPCDTPAGHKCHCRICTGNSNLSCENDAQCAAAGAGTCTSSGGAGVHLNQCDNFQCSPNFDCTLGPVDSYCDGKVYPDGRGYIPCSTNDDCTQNSAGSCTLQELRHCFPDPIEYQGKADVYKPLDVSAFCVAPTSNPAINIASGLPGPGALQLQFDNEIFCKSNPSVPYEFPSGENCLTTGSTTTTTLLPLPTCDEAASPVCGGVCPTGQTCGDSSGVCTCTGIPLPSCESATSPSCGGLCTDPTQVCLDSSGTCKCTVVTLPQCTDQAAPVCGGLCPNGEICSNAGDQCECGAPGVPTCGSAIAPTCAGLCDINQACVTTPDAMGCVCQTLPVPTCNTATTPLCLGVCSTGSTCGAVGDACQCTPLPIP